MGLFRSNYSSYSKAQKKAEKAESELDVANGGSTREHMLKAQKKAFSSRRKADSKWEKFLKNPKG